VGGVWVRDGIERGNVRSVHGFLGWKRFGGKNNNIWQKGKRVFICLCVRKDPKN